MAPTGKCLEHGATAISRALTDSDQIQLKYKNHQIKEEIILHIILIAFLKIHDSTTIKFYDFRAESNQSISTFIFIPMLLSFQLFSRYRRTSFCNSCFPHFGQATTTENQSDSILLVSTKNEYILYNFSITSDTTYDAIRLPTTCLCLLLSSVFFSSIFLIFFLGFVQSTYIRFQVSCSLQTMKALPDVWPVQFFITSWSQLFWNYTRISFITIW